MNFDTIFDQRVNNSLQADIEKLPPVIYSVLTSLNEPVILLNNEFSIVFFNVKAQDIIQKISGQLCVIGQDISSLLQAKEELNIKSYLQEAIIGKEIHQQFTFTHNRRTTWLECNFKPIKAEESIVGICVMFKDITVLKELKEEEKKRKIAEQNRIKSEMLFESFMENTPLTAWVTDSKGIMHYLNPTFRKLYNLPLDTMPRHMNEIFPKDLVEEYLENNQLAIQSGHMVEVVERTVRPDGSMAIFKVFKFPMIIGDQIMIGGWAIEITEEATLQEQLTNSIERYNYVNEATSDAIYDWEIDTNIVYRGKGFALLFGFHDPYVPIQTRYNRIHPDDLPEVKKTYAAALQNADVKRWKLKYRFKDANGVYKIVVDKAFIVRENEKAIKVIGAFQDISEYDQLQEKLVLQEKSKKRAIVRSIIETQEKERRQLSVELHDNVNQILSSCKLMLEIAKENRDKAPLLTEKSYQSIQLAIEEIRKISHSLNPSSVEDFGLEEAIIEMIDKINISEKLKIDFKYSISGKKAALKSEDKIALYRIVQEQLNNIVKHADAKNVWIDLSIKFSAVSLVIEDDGKGFNPNKASKGLGLKNIQHRVDYYHGNLALETGKNKGCRMTILLNLATAK